MDRDSYQKTAERFKARHTAAVSEVLDDLGYRNQALPSNIVALKPGMRLAGPVFTIEGRSNLECDYDAPLREILTMLGDVPAGHIAVTRPTTIWPRTSASCPWQRSRPEAVRVFCWTEASAMSISSSNRHCRCSVGIPGRRRARAAGRPPREVPAFASKRSRCRRVTTCSPTRTELWPSPRRSFRRCSSRPNRSP